MKVFPYIPFETSTKTCCFLRNKGLSKWGGYSIDLFTPHFFLSRRALSQAITSLYLIPKWGEPKGGVGWENDDPMSCCKSCNGFTSQIVFYIPEKYHGNLKIDTNRRDSFLEIVGSFGFDFRCQLWCNSCSISWKFRDITLSSFGGCVPRSQKLLTFIRVDIIDRYMI